MKIIVTPEAQAQYTKLPKSEQYKIKKKLKMIEENPYIGKKLSGDLKRKWSVRAWPYRIIYEIIKSREIIYIDAITHRQGAYK